MKELWAGNKSMSVTDEDWGKCAAFEDAVTEATKVVFSNPGSGLC